MADVRPTPGLVTLLMRCLVIIALLLVVNAEDRPASELIGSFDKQHVISSVQNAFKSFTLLTRLDRLALPNTTASRCIFVVNLLRQYSSDLGGVGAAASLSYTLRMPSLSHAEKQVMAQQYHDVFEALEPLQRSMLQIDVYLREKVMELNNTVATHDKTSYMRENVGKTIKTIYMLIRILQPAKLRSASVKLRKEIINYETSEGSFNNLTSLFWDQPEQTEKFCKKLKPYEKTLQLLKTLLLPSHDDDTIIQIHAKDASVKRKQTDELTKVILLVIARSMYTTAFCDGTLRSENSKELQQLGTITADVVRHVYHVIYRSYEKYTVVVGCNPTVSGNSGDKVFRKGEPMTKDVDVGGHDLDNDKVELYGSKDYNYFQYGHQSELMEAKDCEVVVGLGLSEMAVIGVHENLLGLKKDNYATMTSIARFNATIGVAGFDKKIIHKGYQDLPISLDDFRRLIYSGSLRYEGKLHIGNFTEEITSELNPKAYKSMTYHRALPLLINLTQSRLQNILKGKKEDKVKTKMAEGLNKDCVANTVEKLTGVLEKVDGIYQLTRLRGLFRLSVDELNDGGVQYCRGSESFTLELTLNVVNVSLSGFLDPVIFAKRGNIFGSAATERYAAQLNAANEETFRLRKVKTDADNNRIAVIVGATVGTIVGLLIIVAIIVAVVLVMRRRRSMEPTTSTRQTPATSAMSHDKKSSTLASKKSSTSKKSSSVKSVKTAATNKLMKKPKDEVKDEKQTPKKSSTIASVKSEKTAATNKLVKKPKDEVKDEKKTQKKSVKDVIGEKKN